MTKNLVHNFIKPYAKLGEMLRGFIYGNFNRSFIGINDRNNQYNNFATAAYEIYFFRIVDDPKLEKFLKGRLRLCPVIPMVISTWIARHVGKVGMWG